ncbi:hypothetical protein [Geitlerinema sp. PCC 9228]|nr:hypothetical protein [Geitlerinema sp. PCC 9228]
MAQIAGIWRIAANASQCDRQIFIPDRANFKKTLSACLLKNTVYDP